MKNSKSTPKIAVIIGAGPAGLTAAYELLRKSSYIKPIIYEMSDYFGGLARTVNYKGNRIDIGGHRFFSKSERVLAWWQRILPLENTDSKKGTKVTINYHNKSKNIRTLYDGVDPNKTDKVMLIRNRFSRIFFEGKFFEYPVELNFKTMANLGFIRMVKIGISYLRAKFFPRKENSLEDFFINRFGKELYDTFFKDYTEKVWGSACKEIAPQWGAQRVKNLSVSKVFAHMFKQTFPPKATQEVETSLIQKFLYPKLGPGQMWEEVALLVSAEGADIHLHHQIVGLMMQGDMITGVKVKDLVTGEIKTQQGDYFISTMPVKDLLTCIQPSVPENVLEVAQGLKYRDFITVGLLVKKLENSQIVSDNWIYIQDKGVKMGRLQIFNNWSPSLVKDPNTVWLGLEYFCNEGDELWNKEDETFIQFAIGELDQIGIIKREDVLDGTIIRMSKAYPAYTGTYQKFNLIKAFTDKIENLFLVGRNGMHKYNNQDHSMLTAMKAVEHIINNKKQKNDIWEVNTEENYQESS